MKFVDYRESERYRGTIFLNNKIYLDCDVNKACLLQAQEPKSMKLKKENVQL